jgi:hypothetical protein
MSPNPLGLTALLQPPALFVPPPPGNNYRRLDHTLPHTEPSASICTALAAAIDEQDKANAVNEGTSDAQLQRQQLMQSSSNELTPRGEQEYKELFDGVNYRDFGINLGDCGNDGWEFSVPRNVAGGRMTNTVTIPKVPTKGSYFGRCTCGLPQRDAIPCKHMAAVVVSSRIPALSRTNIMLFW